MTKRTWLVTVAARGRWQGNGVAADVQLTRQNLGGTIVRHRFGPGAVDIDLKVAARTAAEACAIVRQRVTAALDENWPIVEVTAIGVEIAS